MSGQNIVWQSSLVSYQERCRLMNQKGMVVWFTGLSGSGKSAISCNVERRLYEMGMKAYVLDGDNLRHGINSDLGFSDNDRNENIRRITEIASLFCDAGMIVLVSAISPFAVMRKAAKDKIGEDRFIEVYVKANIETCIKRDPKGLYNKNINQFTGISSPYEIPKNPDIVLDTGKSSISECTDKIIRAIIKKMGEGYDFCKRT
ncbi:MAG: adenylyl-sulfate kinase [Clostridia bacterium]|nr:adenylyl-sulfate kinase [Clostridia bacterium]